MTSYRYDFELSVEEVSLLLSCFSKLIEANLHKLPISEAITAIGEGYNHATGEYELTNVSVGAVNQMNACLNNHGVNLYSRLPVD